MSALQAFRASRLALKQEQHRSRPRLTVCCRASAQPATHGSRRPLDIAIVGSGIGGLTAAAALAETGAMVRVFEARSQEEALAGPGGIMIQANAEKVLRLLPAPWPPKAEPGQQGASPAQAPQGQAADSDATSSLSEAIYAVGGPILSGGFRDPKGDYLYYADVDSTGLRDIRSNGLSISRTSLQSLLYNAVPPGSVAFGKALAGYAAPPPGQPGRVQLTFEDGSSTTCDVLVAADGIRSKVRSKLLFPDAPEEFVYSGTVCWRGRLPLSAIGRGRDWFYKAVNNDTWGEYWGSGIRFGWFTVGSEAALDPSSPGGIRTEGEEQLCWYAFLNRPQDWKPEPGADEVARLQAAFGGMAAPIPQICAALGPYPMYVNKVMCHKPHPAPWGSGRVTLLGDSAHAMVPTLGQGGCMAIEDALELANQLGAAARQLEGQQGQPGAGAEYDAPAAVSALEGALRRYEEQRAPRAMRVSEQSFQLGQLAMADNPISVWLRNTIYRMTPKSEGDKQFAYLYKDYAPAWQPGVRLSSSGGGATGQQPAGPAVVASRATVK